MRNSVAFGVFVACTVIISAEYEAEEIGSKDPMARAFQTLNPEEKTDFLAYFLALGLKDWAETNNRYPKFSPPKGSFVKSLNISAENIEKFDKNEPNDDNGEEKARNGDNKKTKALKATAKLNIPKDSRQKLLQWTKSEFKLTTKNVVELLRSKKCSGSICLPDIGELCCPW